jgi:hypothetical protein
VGDVRDTERQKREQDCGRVEAPRAAPTSSRYLARSIRHSPSVARDGQFRGGDGGGGGGSRPRQDGTGHVIGHAETSNVFRHLVWCCSLASRTRHKRLKRHSGDDKTRAQPQPRPLRGPPLHPPVLDVFVLSARLVLRRFLPHNVTCDGCDGCDARGRRRKWSLREGVRV